ncbi:MAG: hypothetical protein HC840_00620 [Leptolyngbyaceae cyanobacterium RM2_2_4]|nr:hypothetical protein [Leptolyngbyaceae cyanobacterium RM2_2_4]
MSETTKKFEDLTKEQQAALKKAGRKFVIQMSLNGANYGGLLFMSNLILAFINMAYFNSQGFVLTGAVVLAIIFLRMMGSANKEAAQTFKDTVKKALDNQP